MNDISGIFEQYGIASVFAGVLVEQLGAPFPALPFLLFAGAQGASGPVFALKALAAATAASLLADTLWFLAGRRYGRSVLDLVCRVSFSPASCIRKSELRFERGGGLAVVVAKFIPGVSTLTPPMAGALSMPLLTFVLLDLAGTLLWAGTGIAAGLIFHAQVHALLDAMAHIASTATLVSLLLAAAYGAGVAARRVWVTRKLRKAKRISPQGLAGLLRGSDAPLVLHVGSGALMPSGRIPGAIEVALGSSLVDAARRLPPGTRVVTYCDCPADASAARAALLLANLGHASMVLDGGARAWTAAGLPTST